ncbi:MAG: AbiJ-NTD4 domain-containing protein, partial [Ktedonobacteraceae bacterium]
MGIKPVRTVFQKDSMDDSLRTSLWNELTEHYWPELKSSVSGKSSLLDSYLDIKFLFEALWTYHFTKPVDEIDIGWSAPFNELKDYFFSCLWYEIYDIIQFVANFYFDA